MSNSILATYTNISPHKTSPRNHAIDTITIHCIVGQWTAKQGCDYFATTKEEASPNYVVGKDGSVGLSVPETDRSWCSSNRDNDHRAVTIEVASTTSPPFIVTGAAYEALLDLVTDICQRNGKRRLLWFGAKELTMAYAPAADEMVMTVHKWFANKDCPGDYLLSYQGAIAAEVTQRLSELAKATPDSHTAVDRYDTMDQIPDWAVPTVRKLVNLGAIRGNGNQSEGGTSPDMDLSQDMLRVLVMVDRTGTFDKL